MIIRALRHRMTVTLLAVVAACGGASAQQDPAAETAADRRAGDDGETDAAERAAPGASSPDPGAASGERAAARRGAPGRRQPVLAVDSDPPGLSPLSEPERQELKAKCAPVARALERRAAQDRHRRKAAAYVAELAAKPPAIAGVNVPRCAELMLRDVQVYEAKRLESKAINNLKMIVVGLSGAMAGASGRLCPSAPPVPKELSAVAQGPYQAPASVWQAEGWRCAKFNLRGAPQRFQYELKTDPQKQSYQIVARGFPVLGQPVVELFLSGRVQDGIIQPTSDVYRR